MLNLAGEDRVTQAEGVRDEIGADFAARSPQDTAAAELSVKEAQQPLWSPSSSLLGLYRSPSSEHER